MRNNKQHLIDYCAEYHVTPAQLYRNRHERIKTRESVTRVAAAEQVPPLHTYSILHAVDLARLDADYARARAELARSEHKRTTATN